MNENMLKGQIVTKGLTQAQAAKMFGMSAISLSRKLLQKREFTLAETLRIKECLQLSDKMYADIFLCQSSQISDQL